ncbi:hypothetical protein C8Q80DRAFT_795435 [Daedaleopsis nitida]|nr:hypothetical protein C8Q80DRAFT_795435 [Daedaleopsis nitida]
MYLRRVLAVMTYAIDFLRLAHAQNHAFTSTRWFSDTVLPICQQWVSIYPYHTSRVEADPGEHSSDPRPSIGCPGYIQCAAGRSPGTQLFPEHVMCAVYEPA